jgi:hypothetical protein
MGANERGPPQTLSAASISVSASTRTQFHLGSPPIKRLAKNAVIAPEKNSSTLERRPWRQITVVACSDLGLTFRRRRNMDIAYVSALSALAGTVVGGLTSGITTLLSQRARTRAEQLAHDKSWREDLYKDFIVAASKAYTDAMMSNEPQLEELVALYAMISRMRVQSSPQTVGSAEKIMRVTMDTYFAPNKTIREVAELIKSGAGIDPLKDFSEAAREELRGSDR